MQHNHNNSPLPDLSLATHKLYFPGTPAAPTAESVQRGNFVGLIVVTGPSSRFWSSQSLASRDLYIYPVPVENRPDLLRQFFTEPVTQQAYNKVLFRDPILGWCLLWRGPAKYNSRSKNQAELLTIQGNWNKKFAELGKAPKLECLPIGFLLLSFFCILCVVLAF